MCTKIYIFFIWCPGHVGIAGNESADKAAKAALSAPDEAIDPRFPLADASSVIKHITNKLWANEWKNETTGRLAYSVKPNIGHRYTVNNLKRPLFCIINKLLCNRAPFNSFLCLIGETDNNLCSNCQVVEDSHHFLINCCKFDLQRHELRASLNNINIPFSFINLLGGATASPPMLSLLYIALDKFIQDTVGYNFFLFF